MGGALSFVYSGLYDVSATDQHLAPTYHAIRVAMQRSVARRAADIPVPELDKPAQLERGLSLYRAHCVQCHGVERNGRGINSRDMSVQPRDHSDAKGMGGIPDQELFDAIKKGGLAVNKSVLMPAWGEVMSDAEIHELVAYLRHICNCGSDQ
jgi:cytochrome c oxidase cbb3-type subunit 3